MTSLLASSRVQVSAGFGPFLETLSSNSLAWGELRTPPQCRTNLHSSRAAEESVPPNHRKECIPMTKTWLDELRENAAVRDAELRARHAKREQRRRRQMEARHTPMAERLACLIRDLPEDERHQPRGLEFFQQALAPRYRGRRAHPAHVAQGLRDLGWRRHRNWRGTEAGFRAMWYPPTGTHRENVSRSGGHDHEG